MSCFGAVFNHSSGWCIQVWHCESLTRMCKKIYIELWFFYNQYRSRSYVPAAILITLWQLKTSNLPSIHRSQLVFKTYLGTVPSPQPISWTDWLSSSEAVWNFILIICKILLLDASISDQMELCYDQSCKPSNCWYWYIVCDLNDLFQTQVSQTR